KKIKQFTQRGQKDHQANFIKAVRSRKQEDIVAPILDGHLSSALCHLGNISYRVGKQVPPTLGPWLTFDPKSERFTGTLSEEANKLVKREYRAPYVIPDQV